MLSKSFNGRTSISIAKRAMIKLVKAFWQTQKQEIYTAIKQVKLPATVFPPEKGITMRPITFPTRLAVPSPKESAKIPTLAASAGKNNAAQIIPITRVTGPKTNLFSSLFLAAISVMFPIIGKDFPFNLKDSLIQYRINTKHNKKITGQ